MSEYTPTTEGIRNYWITQGIKRSSKRDRRAAEFDRWLAAHDRDIAAKERERIRHEAFCQGASWRSEHVTQNPYKLK